MDIEQIIYNIAVGAIPLLFAITLHEVAHGWTAYKLGDTTAKMLGRLSLNPIKHIDPVGTILVPLALFLLSTGIMFGWAKPVPVNTRNLKTPHRDMAIVALAGPAANLGMAIFWMFFLKFIVPIVPDAAVMKGFSQMAWFGIVFNILLMVFNLLPLPPLDGGRILSGITPPSISDMINRIEPYGFFILIGLIAIGALQPILEPMIVFTIKMLQPLFNLNLI